ncbi:MAG: DUF86 domain-containing protein [Candidatus Woesearchaeota archaeon]
MNKEPRIFLEHIMEAVNLVESFTRNGPKEKFFKDKLVQSGVIRQMEVIGEAVKNLPLDFVNRYPQVPWGNIAKMRDKLIHNYFGVNLEITYKVVKEELPKLKEQVSKILKELSS